MDRGKIKYILFALVPSIIIIGTVLLLNVKIGKILPGIITGYGSVIFTNNPEGIKCWDYTSDRVEFDYSSVSGSTDYSKGYLTLKADEGAVDGITCSYIDSQFIEVLASSPTESFENAGFEGWGSLADGESVTFEYHVTVVGGKTWTDATTKSISISCDVDNCDTATGIGNCDFYEDVDFYNSATESCS